MKKVLPVIAILSSLALVVSVIARFAFEVNIPTSAFVCLFLLTILPWLGFIGAKNSNEDKKSSDEDALTPDGETEENIEKAPLSETSENETVNDSASEEAIEKPVAAEEIKEDMPEKVQEEVKEVAKKEVESTPDETSGVAESKKPVSNFAASRYKRSYMSKLIQSEDELKGYYSKIKNAFMSYKKVTSVTSREHERIRFGRNTIAVIKLRGKTILLYLALDPKQYENTMYVGEDVSNITKFAEVPFLYRVNGPRKADRALKLIATIAENLALEAKEEKANEDYIKSLPYEDDNTLIAKGLIIDSEAEKTVNA